jgi:hypothetical protein
MNKMKLVSTLKKLFRVLIEAAILIFIFEYAGLFNAFIAWFLYVFGLTFYRYMRNREAINEMYLNLVRQVEMFLFKTTFDKGVYNGKHNRKKCEQVGSESNKKDDVNKDIKVV